MSYRNLILKADRAEYIQDYKKAIEFLKLALNEKQDGSITKNWLKDRINELQENI